MESKIPKTKSPNVEKYAEDDLRTAYRFAQKIYQEFGTFLKAVVLFGSTTKLPQKRGDIDILVLIDDATLTLTPELVETYRIIIEKSIAEISTRLHVISLKLTTFWEYVRAGDPVGINILRDGVAILDTGFFDPLQALLLRGRIKPSPEAIWNYFARAPKTLHNSRWHLLQATLDLYWAVIDSAHAVLMKVGEIPPSPDHVADLMEEKLAKPKLIERKYVDLMKRFYTLSKKIIYREIKDISGKEYEHYYKDAEMFVNRMQEFINKE